jgi:hypothetical protein
VERHEIEAENYQRLRSGKAEPLTLDTITKFSRHSDSGSQHSMNTSSRGSSGGKTKGTVANSEITVKVNGVTVGLSGDGAENHSIKIQSKANGGVNISVDGHEPADQDNKVTSIQKRDSSTTSSSKQSRKSSLKENRMPRAHSLDREGDQRAKASSWSSQALHDDSPGYGYGWGWFVHFGDCCFLFLMTPFFSRLFSLYCPTTAFI